jgi:D-arabinose 1-dehydrogenase-like Zn-dependent alcohol dehydrogenase
MEVQVKSTYRAVEAYEPGRMRLVERPIPEPGPGQVRIRVEACGVCHTDSILVEQFKAPGVTWPRVPGHEVVGKIEALGEGVTNWKGRGVTNWKIGKRVGVGLFGGECTRCEPCRRGDAINCQNPIWVGLAGDGGYADIVIAEARALASVPDEISPEEAAPLLCAGVTTYNALRNAGLRGGDLVAIQGVGGLGHLGIQYARKMGFRVVAIARGTDKETLARKLGAHFYIDSEKENAAEALQKLGGAKAILATASNAASMGPLFPGLAARGRLIVAGTDGLDVNVNSMELLFGGRVVEGTLTGNAIDEEDTLNFSVLTDIHPMIETMPLERAAEAYARMMRNEARFRMVLTTGN